MADKPILFSGPMVRAILNGRKTMTRRVLKPPYGTFEMSGGQLVPLVTNVVPGDRLYVREAWRTICSIDTVRPRYLDAGFLPKITYEADPENRNPLWAFGRLRPGMHMPRWASRITLTVTDVKVERVADISHEDATAEGCPGWQSEPHPDVGVADGQTPAEEFRDLWDSLNAKRGFGWDVNPWVVAYTFTVHRGNIDEAESG